MIGLGKIEHLLMLKSVNSKLVANEVISAELDAIEKEEIIQEIFKVVKASVDFVRIQESIGRKKRARREEMVDDQKLKEWLLKSVASDILKLHGKSALGIDLECSPMRLVFVELDDFVDLSNPTKVICMGNDEQCHLRLSIHPLVCTFQAGSLFNKGKMKPMIRAGFFVDNHPPLVICRANGSNDLLVSGEHAWLAAGDTLQICENLTVKVAQPPPVVTESPGWPLSLSASARRSLF
jgi:hypothetical protein